MKKIVFIALLLFPEISIAGAGIINYHTYRNEVDYPVHIEAQFSGCATHKLNLKPFRPKIDLPAQGNFPGADPKIFQPRELEAQAPTETRHVGWCVFKKIYFVISFYDGSKRRITLDDSTYGEALPDKSWWFTVKKGDDGKYRLEYENGSSKGFRYFNEYMAPGATSYVNKPQ